MNHNKGKVQAYTVVEMLIVMLLSAIVIGLALLILSLIQRHVFTIQKSSGLNAEMITLEKTLTNDMDMYSCYVKNLEDELWCIMPSDTVVYRFKDDFILRNEDTIWVRIQDKKFYLKANEIKEGPTDALELFLDEDELFFYKHIDASFYMNTDLSNN